MLAKQADRFFRQAVEGQYVAAQLDELGADGGEVLIGNLKRRAALQQAGDRIVVATAVVGQHPAPVLRVPEAGQGVGRDGELLAVVDQAHFRIGVGDGVGGRALGDAGNALQVAEAPELALGIGHVIGLQRLHQLLLDVVLDLRGVGGKHIVVATPVGAELLAQAVVATDQADVDLDPVALGKLLHQVAVGITRPGEDAQGLLGQQRLGHQARQRKDQGAAQVAGNAVWLHGRNQKEARACSLYGVFPGKTRPWSACAKSAG